MLKTLLTSAFAVMVASSAVQAADLVAFQPEPMASYTPAFVWTGFYVGANAGYGWGTVDTSIAGAPNYDIKGFGGGVHAGYNYDLGGFVVGAEADFSLSDMNYTGVYSNVTTSLRLENYGSVRARLGLPVDRFLPYVTGGFAYGRGTLTASAGGTTMAESKTHTGWTVGAGAEYAATDNVVLRAEYLYTDLGSQTYLGSFNGGAAAQVNFSTVRAGVSFKF